MSCDSVYITLQLCVCVCVCVRVRVRVRVYLSSCSIQGLSYTCGPVSVSICVRFSLQLMYILCIIIVLAQTLSFVSFCTFKIRIFTIYQQSNCCNYHCCCCCYTLTYPPTYVFFYCMVTVVQGKIFKGTQEKTAKWNLFE